MSFAETAMILLITLLGGAAVVAAVVLKQPLILLGLFVLTGIVFALYASVQAGKARRTWPKYRHEEDF